MRLRLCGTGATLSVCPTPLLFSANSPPPIPVPPTLAMWLSCQSDSCPQPHLESAAPAGRVGGVVIRGKYHREKPRSACRSSQVSVLPEAWLSVCSHSSLSSYHIVPTNLFWPQVSQTWFLLLVTEHPRLYFWQYSRLHSQGHLYIWYLGNWWADGACAYFHPPPRRCHRWSIQPVYLRSFHVSSIQKNSFRRDGENFQFVEKISNCNEWIMYFTLNN